MDHLDKFDKRAERVRLRSRMIALVLACATLITLDHSHDSASPLASARNAVGAVFGPVEETTSAAVRPFTAIPDWLHGHQRLSNDIATLQAENSQLRQKVARTSLDRNKLAEYDGLTAAASSLGQALVPARVVAYGAAQSFSRTVTIDAGSRSGIQPDETVLNNDGLVGRVLRVTRSTATVLLVLDAQSVVGGRVGQSMEVGFVHGQGSLGDSGRLDLELVDQASAPTTGDTVVTWGSQGEAPYISGVPIGRVAAVYSSLRESSRHAVLKPFVDFGALDLVGVVVPSGTHSDRAVVEADGTLQ